MLASEEKDSTVDTAMRRMTSPRSLPLQAPSLRSKRIRLRNSGKKGPEAEAQRAEGGTLYLAETCTFEKQGHNYWLRGLRDRRESRSTTPSFHFEIVARTMESLPTTSIQVGAAQCSTAKAVGTIAPLVIVRSKVTLMK